MKLRTSMRINGIQFFDNNQKDTIVMSFNLNETVGDYLKRLTTKLSNLKDEKMKLPNSIYRIMSFEFSLQKKL